MIAVARIFMQREYFFVGIELCFVLQLLVYRRIGHYLLRRPDTMRRGLDDFIRSTGADELMMIANIFDV
jgi:hypothetical protein